MHPVISNVFRRSRLIAANSLIEVEVARDDVADALTGSVR